MKNNNIIYIIITISIFLLHPSILRGQDKYDVFYLSIGSEHFIQDKDKLESGFLGLDNLNAASNSAIKMAKLFDSFGAIYGKLFLSKNENTITNESVFKELNSLIYNVKKSKVRKPLIILYYAGHGFSSGDYSTHFIPPGNFNKNPKSLTWEDWIEESIVPLMIKENLDSSNIDYLMFLDCCYEGKQKEQMILSNEIQEKTGTKEVMSLFKDIGNILNNLNTFTGPNPVIFSCPPGLSVYPDLYDFGNGKEEVAPLCRRIHLVFNNKLKNQDVSISDLVILLKSETLDSRTTPSFSTWSFVEQNLSLLRKRIK